MGCISAQQGAVKLEASQAVRQAKALAVGKSKGVLPIALAVPASPAQRVPPRAPKLAFAWVFNGPMDADGVVPSKSTVCLRVGEGKQQKQKQCPQVGPLHHIGKGPSYNPISKLSAFRTTSGFTLMSHRGKLALKS